MLFNSYEFIFVFLPATLAGFFAHWHRFAHCGATLDHLCFAGVLCFMAAA